MRLLLKNTETGLIPCYPSDYDEKKRLKLGEKYWSDIKLARNYEFHKKFFALVKIGWENSPLNMPFNVFRQYATASAGHGYIQEGVLIADSISFDKMSQDEFEKTYNDVLQFIILHIGATREGIENELAGFM